MAARGQSPATVAALWDLIALPTLNLPADEASLALGAFVFRTGLLSRADAGDIGFHDRPLSETIGDPALRALAQAGVDVRLGWRVARLTRSGAGFEVHGGSEELGADAVIVALPHARAATLLEALAAPLARRVAALEVSPIINLHVVYDRHVCELAFAAAVGTPVQYVFDRTEAAGAPAGCQCLAVSLSGAQREMAMSVDGLREREWEGRRLQIGADGSIELCIHRELLWSRVSREPYATIALRPGVVRPGVATSGPHVARAGAWTDTGWPATLESAVMSGHAAASAALQGLSLDPRAAGASAVGAR